MENKSRLMLKKSKPYHYNGQFDFVRDVLKLSGLKPFKVLSVVPIKSRKNVLKGVGRGGCVEGEFRKTKRCVRGLLSI